MADTDQRRGLELSPEELDRALASRPKFPLDSKEVDVLREVIEWFQERKVSQELADIAREKRAKIYPIIFGAISALVAIGSLAISLFVGKIS